jgi:hypothetical protein
VCLVLYSASDDGGAGCRSKLPGAFSINCHMLNDPSMGVIFSCDPLAIGLLVTLAGK